MYTRHNRSTMPLQVLWWNSCTTAGSSLWQDMHGMWQDGPFQEGVLEQKRERAVNELEVKEVQEVNEGEIEMVNIDSVHLNKNLSLLTAELEMQAGRNATVVPYKVDRDSEGNIMPLFIFKNLFKNTTEEQLQKSIKSHIRLRIYNKTNIT